MSSKPELTDLLDTVVSGRLEERIQAKISLIGYGVSAVGPLIQLLANRENSDSWWLIADALGAIGDSRAVEPLLAVLNDPTSGQATLARKYTAWALGQLKDVRATDELIKVLHDRIHDEEDDGEVIDEPDHETIEAAMWALAEIGESRAIEPVIQRIFEGDHWQDGSLLAKWGEPGLMLLLAGLDNDNDSIRGAACSLLGGFGDARAVEPLMAILKSDNSDRVRHHAAAALGELSDSRAYDVLLMALNDKYEQTRAYAALGLGKLRDKRALDALRKAIHDTHPLVQQMANWAIGAINLPDMS